MRIDFKRNEEEHRMDRRLREALASYAKGDSGTPVETVMGRLRKRERKPQTGS